MDHARQIANLYNDAETPFGRVMRAIQEAREDLSSTSDALDASEFRRTLPMMEKSGNEVLRGLGCALLCSNQTNAERNELWRLPELFGGGCVQLHYTLDGIDVGPGDDSAMRRALDLEEEDLQKKRKAAGSSFIFSGD